MNKPETINLSAADEVALLDDHAVDLFAKAMKAKLQIKRAQGYGGWNDIGQCSGERLAELLIAAVNKGDPVDVGNFAMMLFCRSESHEVLRNSKLAAVPPAIRPVEPIALQISIAELDQWIADDATEITISQSEAVALVLQALKRLMATPPAPAEPVVRMFPMQHPEMPITWAQAEIIYAGYSAMYGKQQSLERMAQRGGFGWGEVGVIYKDPVGQNAIDKAIRAHGIAATKEPKA